MAQVINTSNSPINSQVIFAIPVDTNGICLADGTRVINTSLSPIKSQVKLMLAVTDNGDSL